MQRAISLLTLSATLSGFLVESSPHNPSFRRRDVPQVQGYEFSRCYTDKTTSRVLTGSTYFDDSLTNEKCATACAGFKYFGTEYGRECYCGNTLSDESIKTELSDAHLFVQGILLRTVVRVIDSISSSAQKTQLHLQLQVQRLTRTMDVTPSLPMPGL